MARRMLQVGSQDIQDEQYKRFKGIDYVKQPIYRGSITYI